MRKLVALLPILALASWVCASHTVDPRPRNVGLSLAFTQATDSIGIQVRFTPATPGPRQFPIAYHEIAVMETGGDMLGLSNPLMPQSVDTVLIPMPAINDTTVIYASVWAVDTADQISEPAISDNFYVVITPLPPLPPDSVTVDTIPGLAEVVVWPDSVEVVVGQTVQFCAFGRLADGTPVRLNESAPVPACDAMFETFSQGDPSLTHYFKALNLIAIGRSEQG